MRRQNQTFPKLPEFLRGDAWVGVGLVGKKDLLMADLALAIFSVLQTFSTVDA